MKRIAVLILSCALLLTTIVGCGKKNESTGGQNSVVPDKKVTLTVWESTGGPDEFIKRAGKKYTELHPDVTINYVNVEIDDSAAQLSLDGPAGVGPDLFAAPHDKIGQLVQGGHIEETVSASDIKERVLKVCSDAITYNGKMYGYPISAETYALFYNKKLVKTPPKTFEELERFCKTYNKKDNYGLMFDVANGYYTIIFTTSDNNRPLAEYNTQSSDSKLNNDVAVKGMKYFQSLRKNILDVPAADLTTAVADEAFRSGKSAMHITGPWNLSSFRNAGIDFGVTTLPCLPGQDTPPASFSGTRTMFVSAYSKHKKESADFASFLLTDEMQKLRYDLTQAIPSVHLYIDDEHIKGFMEQLEYSYAMPSVPQMAKFWDVMNSASSNIWDGADVKKELDACDKAIANS